jgi:hypothetical protein
VIGTVAVPRPLHDVVAPAVVCEVTSTKSDPVMALPEWAPVNVTVVRCVASPRVLVAVSADGPPVAVVSGVVKVIGEAFRVHPWVPLTD